MYTLHPLSIYCPGMSTCVNLQQIQHAHASHPPVKIMVKVKVIARYPAWFILKCPGRQRR